jgi:hypothetical protein
VRTKKPAEKGKSEKAPADNTDAHSAEIAFDEIMDAILGADPDAVRQHQKQRRSQKKKRST